MANSLANATSPYLLQHAENPVDWWEWGPEAFAEAKRRDTPILLSVGYAACHWCHVMAHESFEDEGIAARLNDGFVAIKVDREERPDVDAVYMAATQAMTGQGGWPMTVFATPDGEPFYCGTYFPRPAFAQLISAVGQAWREQRDAVVKQGAAVVEAIRGAQRPGSADAEVTDETLDAAVAGLKEQFDEQHAGFGGAPKFPPHLVMLFLLRHYQRTGDPDALEMVRATAEQMARGGMYDQVGGGFARYSVDATWTVPHFEKMLYDNAMLLRVYTFLWRLSGDRLARRIAYETAAFLRIDLGTSEGGFASSLDADTDGVEGATYVWTPAQLDDALGGDDGAWAADLFGVTASGTFEHGSSVLRLARDIDDADEPIRQRWLSARQRLRAARAARPQPGRDDKVIAEWNGLTITALAEFAAVARAMGDGETAGAETVGAETVGAEIAAARHAAVAAGELLARTHMVDGRLRRASRGGMVGEPSGVLADYGCVAEAFATLYQVTGDAVWLRRSGELLDVALEQFSDEDGGFFDTAADAEALVTRPADPTDGATPSGNSAVMAALITQTALTGEGHYRAVAESALGRVAPIIASHARFAGLACACAEALHAGPMEIAIVGADAAPGVLAGAASRPDALSADVTSADVTSADVTSADVAALIGVAWRLAPPGAVIVAGAPDAPGQPLLADRPCRDGAATAYVCHGFVCDLPVVGAQALAARLDPSR